MVKLLVLLLAVVVAVNAGCPYGYDQSNAASTEVSVSSPFKKGKGCPLRTSSSESYADIEKNYQEAVANVDHKCPFGYNERSFKEGKCPQGFKRTGPPTGGCPFGLRKAKNMEALTSCPYGFRKSSSNGKKGKCPHGFTKSENPGKGCVLGLVKKSVSGTKCPYGYSKLSIVPGKCPHGFKRAAGSTAGCPFDFKKMPGAKCPYGFKKFGAYDGKCPNGFKKYSQMRSKCPFNFRKVAKKGTSCPFGYMPGGSDGKCPHGFVKTANSRGCPIGLKKGMVAGSKCPYGIKKSDVNVNDGKCPYGFPTLAETGSTCPFGLKRLTSGKPGLLGFQEKPPKPYAMSRADQVLIQGAWRLAKKNGNIAPKAFIRYFQSKPKAQLKFRAFANVPLTKLPSNGQFQNQVYTCLSGLNAYIEHLGKSPKPCPYLTSDKYKVEAQDLREFGQILFNVMQEEMGSSFTQEARDAFQYGLEACNSALLKRS